jgi:hypothetical protein
MPISFDLTEKAIAKGDPDEKLMEFAKEELVGWVRRDWRSPFKVGFESFNIEHSY